MQELATLARPYAKAVFKLSQENNALENWSLWLKQLALAISYTQLKDVISNPLVSEAEKVSIFLAVTENSDEKVKNFLQLLAENKRLPLLSAISEQYEFLKFQHENAVQATVISAVKLSDAQLETLKGKVKDRLKKEIQLRAIVDESIIGGVIIKAGDLVIDSSIRGKLNQLAEQIH